MKMWEFFLKQLEDLENGDDEENSDIEEHDGAQEISTSRSE